MHHISTTTYTTTTPATLCMYVCMGGCSPSRPVEADAVTVAATEAPASCPTPANDLPAAPREPAADSLAETSRSLAAAEGSTSLRGLPRVQSAAFETASSWHDHGADSHDISAFASAAVDSHITRHARVTGFGGADEPGPPLSSRVRKRMAKHSLNAALNNASSVLRGRGRGLRSHGSQARLNATARRSQPTTVSAGAVVLEETLKKKASSFSAATASTGAANGADDEASEASAGLHDLLGLDIAMTHHDVLVKALMLPISKLKTCPPDKLRELTFIQATIFACLELKQLHSLERLAEATPPLHPTTHLWPLPPPRIWQPAPARLRPSPAARAPPPTTTPPSPIVATRRR